MQPDFWHKRWQSGQIGFHQSAVDRHLERYWPELGLANDSRVFVPLCGKSLDLLWLQERHESVTGVELSAVALESFCAAVTTRMKWPVTIPAYLQSFDLAV